MARDVGKDTLGKWKELFRRLKYATENKRLQWKETSNPEVFLTSLGTALIVFGELDGPTQLDYFFRVENQEGETVDEFTDVDLDGDELDGGKYFHAFKKFHQDLKRHISGADQFLDGILQNLPNPDDDGLF